MEEGMVFGILHRHWIWADTMRREFDRLIGSVNNSPEFDIVDFLISPVGCHMVMWYGLLFVVLEGIKHRSVDIGPLEPTAKEIFEDLRDFRNSIFHVQNEYWSPKMLRIITHPESARKIRDVHEGLGQFFLRGN